MNNQIVTTQSNKTQWITQKCYAVSQGYETATDAQTNPVALQTRRLDVQQCPDELPDWDDTVQSLTSYLSDDITNMQNQSTQ